MEPKLKKLLMQGRPQVMAVGDDGRFKGRTECTELHLFRDVLCLA